MGISFASLLDSIEIGEPVSIRNFICFPFMSSVVVKKMSRSDILFMFSINCIFGYVSSSDVDWYSSSCRNCMGLDLQTLLKCPFLLQFLQMIFLAGHWCELSQFLLPQYLQSGFCCCCCCPVDWFGLVCFCFHLFCCIRCTGSVFIIGSSLSAVSCFR